MYRILILFTSFGLLCCQPPTVSSPAMDSHPYEEATHLPIKDLLHQDLINVDSVYTVILLKKRQGQIRDSVYITLQSFHELSRALLPRGLDSATFQDSFTETSFKDETTGLIQFLYEDTTYRTDLKKVIAYIQPGTENDEIKRIYIESAIPLNDSILDRKIIWNIGHYITVAERVKKENGKETNRITKMIWDPAHFSED